MMGRRYKGVSIVWGTPEKHFPVLSDVRGRIEFGGECEPAIFYGDDGNRYVLQVVDGAWVPRRGTWHPEAGRAGEWWWDIPNDAREMDSQPA